ncbi:serpentine type 7TM GPCR chemoreceptor srt domain-containing protein [Ditylenchus destructor]|uniref:Serpentine type 7TM GPCR chemoreceptor srt domain-containing protein n=1 Tax=Ditylenchus destructor TaxID=166010 RepID=A0AAD4R254_9BILA|nr:serpentine type 7TM GPCR chemoreceptor srt domain-containing protein [Ditylenchus destructor]
MSNRTTDATSIPPPQNNFNSFPSLIKFDNYYDSCCTNGLTYLFYLTLYIPVLIVIRRSSLFRHTSYKLMFAIGIMDNISGFVFTFSAGVMSIAGINYSRLSIYRTHDLPHFRLTAHNWLERIFSIQNSLDYPHFVRINSIIRTGLLGTYSMLTMILALNRCVEMYSNRAAEAMWAGSRIYYWTIPATVWGLLFFSSWDVPPV